LNGNSKAFNKGFINRSLYRRLRAHPDSETLQRIVRN
jgi:hypothetical protein